MNKNERENSREKGRQEVEAGRGGNQTGRETRRPGGVCEIVICWLPGAGGGTCPLGNEPVKGSGDPRGGEGTLAPKLFFPTLFEVRGPPGLP